MKGLFVTGTDTGVGKTLVSCSLAAAFAQRGHAVGVMKPCETGDGDDAARLIAATGRPLPLADVSPYRFRCPPRPRSPRRRLARRSIWRAFAPRTTQSRATRT